MLKTNSIRQNPCLRIYNSFPAFKGKASACNLSCAEDEFVKQKNSIASPKEFCKRKSKIEISDYLAMDESVKKEILSKAPEEIKEAVLDNIYLADDLKKYLDKKYGENGYIFASIGTSPSLIAKVFEYMGVETKYLPISGFSVPDKRPDLKTLFNDYGFKNYAKVLKQQGLTPLNVLTNPKKIIFYDYIRTGKTLEAMEEILTKGFRLPKFRLEFGNIAEDILASAGDSDLAFKYIDEYLVHNRAADYTSTKHINYLEAGTAAGSTKHMVQYDEKNTKYFNFLLMSTLEKFHKLKENPANKTGF